jgi:hypothetical protein
MRTVPLTSIAIIITAIAAVLISRVPEDVAVALVVVPLLLCIVSGLTLTLTSGGWRRSHGLKELLLYGPLQAVPDTWTSRVARIPTVFLTLSASVAVGAILGMLLASAS